MRVTVGIITYKRAWSIPFVLSSLVNQTRRPDEVIIVLKPSGDNSEDIISKFFSVLPIKLLIQREGSPIQAYQIALNNASGDIILFIDDDAIAEERWVEKYIKLFSILPNAGGIGGEVHGVYLKNHHLVKVQMRHNLNKSKVMLPLRRLLFLRSPFRNLLITYIDLQYREL